MKKSSLILIILLTAAISSAATVGVMKISKKIGTGGSIIILSDKRCDECNTSGILSSLKTTFPNNKVKVVDYSTSDGKKLFKKENLKMLPQVLLPKSLKETPEYAKVARFAVQGKDYIHLRTGGKFDPTAEICDNNKDDNNNKLVDCEDPACKTDWKCMEKKETPEVDVFVMSHCPFGTQIEKGLLPVWDLIGDKIDLNIRFVDYAMHGQKEIDEQLRQYCMQKKDMDSYRKYLECFLKEGKDDDSCLKEIKISKSEIEKCVKEADEKYGISKDYKDKSKWKGRFPPFGIHSDLNKKYGVRGSPTVVINEVVAKTGRSPKALLDAICKAFKEPPEECKQKLDEANPSPGFGFKKGSAGGKAPAAKCGT